MRQNLGQLVTRIQANTGINAATYDTKVKAWLNEVYEDVYDTFLWPGSLIRGSLSTVVSQDFLVMPPNVRRVIFLSQESSPEWLRFSDTAQFVRSFFANFGSTGTPTDWTDDGESPVLAQPSAASVLAIASASASDVAQSIRIQGRDANGVFLTESVQLSGLTPVNSANSYTSIEMISKTDTTVGIVTITSNAAAVTVARIAPRDLDSKSVRVRLNAVPSAVISIYYIAKRQLYRLVNDEDQLLIDVDSAVVAGATALALREQGDLSSETWAARAGSEIQKRRDEILGQGMRTLKLQPDAARNRRSNFFGSW